MIDTAEQKVVAEIPIGQAPQALVFVPGAVPKVRALKTSCR